MRTLISLGLSQTDIAKCLNVSNVSIHHIITKDKFGGVVVKNNLFELISTARLKNIQELYVYIRDKNITRLLLSLIKTYSCLKRLDPERAELMVYEQVLTGFTLGNKLDAE